MINLNWKELERLAPTLEKETTGFWVDRIVVPKRIHFPGGFIKDEWILRLNGASQALSLYVSIRNQKPAVGLYPNTGPKAAPDGTQSPFIQFMNSTLKGLRVESIEAIHQDRILVVWFSSQRLNERVGLVLQLIPTRPQCFLIQGEGPPFKLLAHSRQKASEALSQFYEFPERKDPPREFPIRAELADSAFAGVKIIESKLEEEAFQQRWGQIQKLVQQKEKALEKQITKSRQSVQHAEDEPNWQLYGDTLKGHLHQLPTPESGVRELLDYQSDQRIAVPIFSGLSPQQELARHYQLAKRKARRLEESMLRLRELEERLAQLQALTLRAPRTFAEIVLLERKLGLSAEGAKPSKSPKKRQWQGKSFVSADGLPIYVGRKSEENLRLTFQVANGNDVWLHLRGRPGAHVVVPLPKQKSAPLQTLLDAATLTVYYSDGGKTGKAEVDYTFKKYVKRIKNSTEVSYSQNKTLLVEVDTNRLKRLMNSQML